MKQDERNKAAKALSDKKGDHMPVDLAGGTDAAADETDFTALLPFAENGQEIPDELCEVVAKILVFISRIDRGYE